MDFNDTPQEAEFRAKCRAWLEANAELKTKKTNSAKNMNISYKLMQLFLSPFYVHIFVAHSAFVL